MKNMNKEPHTKTTETTLFHILIWLVHSSTAMNAPKNIYED